MNDEFVISSGKKEQDVRITGDGTAFRYAVDGNAVYLGEARIGTGTNMPLWKISKFDSSTGSITWADGNETADNIWDNRASLTYL